MFLTFAPKSDANFPLECVVIRIKITTKVLGKVK